MTADALAVLFERMQKQEGLPALEHNVSEVITRLRDSSMGPRELVEPLLRDPGLAQRVLRLANSPMYAAMSSGVRTLTSAVSILGAEVLLHIVLSVTVMSAAELDDDDALAANVLAGEVAREAAVERREDVCIAVLLYDLGQMMAGRYLPEYMADWRARVAQGMAADAAAEAVFGMGLQALGARVAERWRLPAEIVAIIDGTGDAGLVDMARASHDIANGLLGGDIDVNRLLARLPAACLGRVPAIRAEMERRLPFFRERLRRLERVPAAAAPGSGSPGETAELIAPALLRDFLTKHGAGHVLVFRQEGDAFVVCAAEGDNVAALREGLKIPVSGAPTPFHVALRSNNEVFIEDVARLQASALPDSFRTLLPDVAALLVMPIKRSAVSGFVYCDWSAKRQATVGLMAAMRVFRNTVAQAFPAD